MEYNEIKCTIRLSTNDAGKTGHPYTKYRPWHIPHTILKLP